LSRTASERADRSCILTINGGSSSLKFAVFAMADQPARLLSGRVERIGVPGSRLVVVDADGAQQEDNAVEVPDQAAAVDLLIRRLGHAVGLKNLADLASYVRTQEQAGALYQQPDAWARRAIVNVAHSGKFSSDRTIRDYARGIWRAEPCPVDQP
jgi:hypothetical protein